VNVDIPSTARSIVAAYLEAVDAEAPGLVVGLYLTGSIALGDFRPGTSDIDFVAVTDGRAGDSAVAVLERVHRSLNVNPRLNQFDGIYVTWNDLARDPAECAPVPFNYNRRFHEAGRFELSPVTWATLARHGVAVRGPAPATLSVWDDTSLLDAWTRQNLLDYWQPWRDRRSRLVTKLGRSALRADATAWGALGVSRLHHTLVTGNITSKYGAGMYALHALPPRWHTIVLEAMRIRRGDGGRSLYRTPFGRRRDLLAFITFVIEDGLALPAG
jgi:predicted nucleotidyltransferase